MTTLELRPYQVDAVDAAFAAWERGVQRAAHVMATGGGKTVIFARIAELWTERHRLTPRQRVLVLVHREELAEQARAKIVMMAPHLRVSVVQGDRGNFPATADVVVAMVQTLRTLRRRELITHVGLVIVDECHHAAAATYRIILEHYGCFSEGGARSLGVTATMTRADGLALGEIWQEVVYVKETLELVRAGYLVAPRGKLVQVDDLDLSRVRKQAGDYSDSALGSALEQSLAPQAVARAYAEHSADRQGILFAPTVHCAGVYGDALAEQGFKSELVHGEMPSGARRSALDNFRAGNTQVLVNCMVMTEGTDLPMASAVVIGRPTKSQGLFTQMAGRGLRLWPGKSDALILVVAGKAAKHSLTAPVDLFGEQLPELGTEELRLEEKQEISEELVFELDGEQGGGITELPDFVDGVLKTVELDLFHQSKSAWLRTYGGIWFLPAGERLIVLSPAEGGLWGVIWCHKSRRGPQNTGWIANDVADMGYAMAYAEANVSPAERTLSSRESSWRSRKPSDPQKDLAARLGLLVTESMCSGEVAGLITVALASQRIDPYLARG